MYPAKTYGTITIKEGETGFWGAISSLCYKYLLPTSLPTNAYMHSLFKQEYVKCSALVVKNECIENIRDLTLNKLLDRYTCIFIMNICIHICIPPSSAIFLFVQPAQYTHTKIVLLYLFIFMIYLFIPGC